MPPGAAEVIRASRFGLAPPPDDGSRQYRRADTESPASVAAALARAGVTDRGEIAAVSSGGGRRSPTVVSFADGSRLFLKWLDTDPLYGSDNEPFILRLLDSVSLPPALRAAVPRIVAFDPDHRLLVLDGVTGFQTMREAALEQGGTSVDPLIRLAAVLGALHGLEVDQLIRAHPDRRLHFPMQSMMDLTPEEFARGPGKEYASYVEAVQAVDREIQGLAARWRPLCLTHFDVRDDNVLVAVDDRPDPLRLVDWELAGFGDPLYDVGTVIGQLVYHSLRRVPTTSDASRASAGGGNGAGPTPGAPAAATFVNAYLAMSPSPRTDARQEIVRYAGVFLLFRALATLQVTGSLGVAGKLSLLLGRRFLARPEVSARLILPELPGGRS